MHVKQTSRDRKRYSISFRFLQMISYHACFTNRKRLENESGIDIFNLAVKLKLIKNPLNERTTSSEAISPTKETGYVIKKSNKRITRV